jgi:hypothetical protein
MPRQTEPRQPIIYDMMLLADAILHLRELQGIKQRHQQFTEREKNLIVALTRIRNLAQFVGKRQDNLINIEDPAFGGIVNNEFMTGYFDRISKYVSHLHETRYLKTTKYHQPKAKETISAGICILQYIKPIIDKNRQSLSGDATHWYNVFETLFKQL